MADGALLALLGLAGVASAAAGVAQLRAARRSRRFGRLRSADVGRRGVRLRARRWRLAGQPDELRGAEGGPWIPVELKRRPAPGAGPLRSHRMQLLAYCVLVEEQTAQAPPFGILRYGDGVEYVVRYGPAQRAELSGLLAEMRAPYDGRARPSPGRCRRCPYRPGCDARAV